MAEPPSRRIVVCGCSGAGKTVLARALGWRLDLPVTHLDALYYDERWTPAPPDVFVRRQREVVAGPAWVLDGNYASTLPLRLSVADVVVFLDLPAWACLGGILARRLRTGGGQDPATGVHDRVTPDLIRYVVGYRRHMRPRVRRLVAEHATGAVVTLTSRRAVHRYLRAMPGRPAGPRRMGWTAGGRSSTFATTNERESPTHP